MKIKSSIISNQSKSFNNIKPEKASTNGYYKKCLPFRPSFGSEGAIRNFAKVSEGLLRGGFLNKKGFQILKTENVSLIIDLRTILDPLEAFMMAIEKIRAKKLGIKHINISVSLYGMNSAKRIQKILDLVENNPKTYIHCMWGQDRTSFVAAAYKIVKQKKEIQAAINDEIIKFGHDYKNLPKLIPNLKKIVPELK